jgi:hypothetical protein
VKSYLADTGSSAKRTGQQLLDGRRRRPGHAPDCEYAESTTNQLTRCYCVVTEGEFVVPSREQLRTHRAFATVSEDAVIYSLAQSGAWGLIEEESVCRS